MADLDPQTAIQFEKRGKVAIITLNAEKKLNAMNLACYFRIAKLLYEIAEMPDIVVTVVTGKGRYFSAYVPSTIPLPPPPPNTPSSHSTGKKTNINLQRRRRLRRPTRPRRSPRPARTLAPFLRRQQPTHNPRLLHAPENPHLRPQRPRSRPLRRHRRARGFRLRRAARVHPNAV